MKKVLSVLLALTMILAMLPTNFAAAEETTEAITYNFQIDYDYETETDARNKSGGYLEYRNNTKKYTSYFAENEDGYGRNWAWLGATVGSKSTTSVATAASVAADSNAATTVAYGSGEIVSNLSSSVSDDYMAVKINIPTQGIYNVTDMYIFNYGEQGSASLEMYVLPASLSIDGATAGDVFASDNTDTWGALASDGTAYVRSGHKVFSALNIPADRYVGTYSASGKSQTFTKADVSEFRQITADTAGDYIVVIHNTDENSPSRSKRISLADFTIAPAKLDKTHKYIFNNTVLTGDILENTAFTQYYRMFYKPEGEDSYSGNYLDSYENLNSSLTDLWAVSLLGGSFNDTSYKFTSSLSETRLQMIGRKRLNNGANGDANFVLKLNVKHDGIYAVTAEVGESGNGTQANIYMLPADGTITNINSEMLKNYNSIGRVSNVTGEVDGDIGTVQLTKGDWYLVFAFNSTNKSTASNSRQYFNLESITLTETDALPESGATPEDVENEDVPEISFSATTSIPDKANVTINEVEGNLKVLNPSRGDEISVSAPEVPGYKFVGWKAGSANDTGDGELANTAKFVKELGQEDTFTVYTSTFLTAVYEELTPADSAASVVEFWNLDGSYLGNKTVDQIQEEGGLPTTSLIGHTFTGWFTAEDVALNIAEIAGKVTHAVAGYTADATLAATSDDGVRVNGETYADANAYGKEVICEDKGTGTVTHWLRDGKVVSYDPTYKYYVWDATNITSSYAPIEKKPLVVLDGDTVSGAYMIEYDKGNADTIVEVGILFGAGTPTVESKSEIFKSQRGDNHGQFAAKPTNSAHTARGYMIYEEDGSYKVIYSE